MQINENKKKGCDKVADSKRNPFKLKLYPPFRNVVKGVHLVKGVNFLEYTAKVNALSKRRHDHPLFMLALKGV
jgi:hypothetical protein